MLAHCKKYLQLLASLASPWQQTDVSSLLMNSAETEHIGTVFVVESIF